MKSTLQTTKPLDSNQHDLNLISRPQSRYLEELDRASPSKAINFSGITTELPWNYNIPTNVPKTLLHHASLITDYVTHNSKDITFALCRIYTGFGFFPLTWPLFPISALLWHQYEDTVGAEETQDLFLALFLCSHSTATPALSPNSSIPAGHSLPSGCRPQLAPAFNPPKGAAHTQASHVGLPASPLANSPPRVIPDYVTQILPLKPSHHTEKILQSIPHGL